MPARKRRRLNRSSSAPSVKIRLNQSFRYEPIFSFKHFRMSFALTMAMSQQRQRTDATEVDSQHNTWDFPEGLPGNSIDPLGSGYLQPVLGLLDGDSASAPFQIHAGGF